MPLIHQPETGTAKDKGKCLSDKDCLQSESCYMGFCDDLCAMEGVCAPTANCEIKMHRPVCTCPQGHGGNPAINCTSLELRKDF